MQPATPSHPNAEAQVKTFVDALRQVLARPKLADQLMSSESSSKAADSLNVPAWMITEIKNVLLVCPRAETLDDSVGPNGSGGEQRKLTQQTMNSLETMNSLGSTIEFLDGSFRQLRNAARVMLGMSLTLFIVGISFLVIAGVRAFTHPESVGTTAVIGGIGIVQIVALFYRNPLRDIGRSVSNAQQSKIAIMSYTLGVTLLGESAYHGRNTAEQQNRLKDLTEDAVRMLPQYVEGDGVLRSGKPSRSRADKHEAESTPDQTATK